MITPRELWTVQEAMREQSVTPSDIAAGTGYSVDHVQRMVSGTKKGSKRSWLAIGNFLGVSFEPLRRTRVEETVSAPIAAPAKTEEIAVREKSGHDVTFTANYADGSGTVIIDGVTMQFADAALHLGAQGKHPTLDLLGIVVETLNVVRVEDPAMDTPTWIVSGKKYTE